MLKKIGIGLMFLFGMAMMIDGCSSIDLKNRDEVKKHLTGKKYEHNEKNLIHMYIYFVDKDVCSITAYSNVGEPLSNTSGNYSIGRVSPNQEEVEIYIDGLDGQCFLQEGGKIYIKRLGEFFFFHEE
jgi:hypothetical protein